MAKAKDAEQEVVSAEETSSTNAIVPDYLMQAIQAQEEMGASIYDEMDTEQDDDFISLPWIQVPQKSSSVHDFKTMGQLHITDGGDMSDYRDELRFILVDSLTLPDPRPKTRATVGHRVMWNPDLHIQEKLCESPNGIAPWPQYLNTEVEHPVLKEKVKIGYRKEYPGGPEVPISDGSVCLTCPFGDWAMFKAAGINRVPCKQGFSYIVYSLDDEMLIRVNAQNTSVHLALQGQRAGSTYAAKSGEALNGIHKFFKSNGTIDEVRPKNTLGEYMYRFVSAFMKSAEDTENQVKVLTIGSDGKPTQIFQDMMGKEEFTHVVVAIPTFPYAPEGLPDSFKADRPIYPAVMTIVPNAATNNPFVPQIELSDEPLTADELVNFMQIRGTYISKEMRARFMALGLIDVAKEVLSPVDVEVTKPEQNQLPPWTQESDTLDGEIVDEDSSDL